MIEGSEAGGHIGPVSLTVLAQEILPHIREVPMFVAGGIGRGEAILSYLEMGASGAQLGTRFAAATDSIAHANFKRAFVRANARDALPSMQLDARFPVIPVRGLVNEGTRRFLEAQAEALARFQSGELTREAAQLEIEHFWAGALRRAVVDGDVESGSVMAGQSVGMVTARAERGRGDRRAGRTGGRGHRGARLTPAPERRVPCGADGRSPVIAAPARPAHRRPVPPTTPGTPHAEPGCAT